MNNTITFTGRSNSYFAITKRGWNYAIPNMAYKQIDNNRELFEKFARENNIKITLTDAGNMLPEFHSASESTFFHGKMAIEVEKRPTLVSKIKSGFSHLKSKIKNEPILEVISVPYYSQDSKKIPSLNEKGKIGFFVDYELDNNKFLNTIVEILQKIVEKKSDKLSNLK